MTTSVKVIAACGEENEVEVFVGDFMTEEVFEQHTLQDGEEIIVQAYDNRAVAVREKPKGTE